MLADWEVDVTHRVEPFSMVSEIVPISFPTIYRLKRWCTMGGRIYLLYFDMRQKLVALQTVEIGLNIDEGYSASPRTSYLMIPLFHFTV